MNRDKTVSDWIVDLKGGDRDAVQAIWSRFFARLCDVTRRRLGTTPRRAADEEDVASSAIHALWEGVNAGRFEKLDDRDDLWQVLVLIATRKAINLRRRTERSPVRGESAAGRLSSIEEAVDYIVDGEPDDELVGALSVSSTELVERLPPKLARVARLKLAGFANREIAEKLGRAERTVERYLSMIRHHWRDLDGSAVP